MSTYIHADGIDNKKKTELNGIESIEWHNNLRCPHYLNQVSLLFVDLNVYKYKKPPWEIHWIQVYLIMYLKLKLF